MHVPVPHSEKGNHFLSVLDGKTFKFDRHDKASRRRALDRLAEHGNELLARIEKIAGRPLSYRELLSGVEHVEDRNVAHRIRDERRQPISIRPGEETDESDPNPFRRLAVMPRRRSHTDPLPNRQQRYSELADEYDRRQSIEEAQRRFDNDPARREAIEHATNLLWELRYNPLIPRSQIEDAKYRLDIARRGKLSEYEIQHQKFLDWEAVRNGERRAALDEKIAALAAERAALEASGYSAPEEEGSEDEQ